MDSVFVDAAACGDLSAVRELLFAPSTTPAQINALDKDGRSAFHYACLNDDVPLFKVLLADSRVDVMLRSPKGDVCVHLSALYAALEVLRIMLQDDRTRSLVDAQNKFGETPLHLCAGSGDKGATRAADLLLNAGASLLVKDQWGRGPLDVARDNAENALLRVLSEFLAKQPKQFQDDVTALSQTYLLHKNDKPVVPEEKKVDQAKMIFGALGGALKGLKKTEINEKTMFAKSEGNADKGGGKDAKATGKILSKLVDFPGDVEEIKALLANPEVSPSGKDSYGLTALHKFASWNKTELMDLLLPRLNKAEINNQDREGKTALHWAVEMASVAAIQKLVSLPDVDKSIKDSKGRTPMDILTQTSSTPIIERLKVALAGA